MRLPKVLATGLRMSGPGRQVERDLRPGYLAFQGLGMLTRLRRLAHANTAASRVRKRHEMRRSLAELADLGPLRLSMVEADVEGRAPVSAPPRMIDNA